MTQPPCARDLRARIITATVITIAAAAWIYAPALAHILAILGWATLAALPPAAYLTGRHIASTPARRAQAGDCLTCNRDCSERRIIGDHSHRPAHQGRMPARAGTHPVPAPLMITPGTRSRQPHQPPPGHPRSWPGDLPAPPPMPAPQPIPARTQQQRHQQEPQHM
jgi:hypothetical protein